MSGNQEVLKIPIYQPIMTIYEQQKKRFVNVFCLKPQNNLDE